MRATTVCAFLLLAGIVALAWRRYRDELAYARAERHYRAGDFEKALLECERVLSRRPGHAEARVLREVISFFPIGESSGHPQVHAREAMVEMDTAHARAYRAFSMWELVEAERETQRILEYAKWLPDGVEQRTYVSSARDLQRRIQAAREGRCGP